MGIGIGRCQLRSALGRDNHWRSQKLSMEKSAVGNEPYIKETTEQVVSLCWRDIILSPLPGTAEIPPETAL